MDQNLHHRASLSGQHFEVIVIGGGINGVAIARECAQAGRRVLVLEQSDFASGTTSRATRIIHGGLRYLEYGDLGLVRESLRDRERLLRSHNHLVRPLDFVLALPRHSGWKRSALAVRAGLWLYRQFAHASSPPRRPPTDELNAALDRNLDLQFFSYTDAQCEYPERLTIEWLTDAIAAGATARNYSTVLEVQVHDGRACGVRVQDGLTQEEYAVSSGWTINAAGPWVDRINHRSGLKVRRLIGGVRGSHLIFNRPTAALAALAGRGTAIYAEGVDGRPLFAIPWAEQLLFGTTEVTEDSDPARTQPTKEEIAYLLQSINRLIGGRQITGADINYAYAGVRPLPYKPGTAISALSRGHELHDHIEEGIVHYLSLAGGKLTTAATLGRQCARKIGCKVPEPGLGIVAGEPGSGWEAALAAWTTSMAQASGLPEEQVRAIVEWHGPRASAVIRLAMADPLLRRPIVADSCHIVAEAMEAVRREEAVRLGDILLRRVPIALGDWGEDRTVAAAGSIGKALGWSDWRLQTEIEAFELERAGFLRKVEAASAASDVAPQSA